MTTGTGLSVTGQSSRGVELPRLASADCRRRLDPPKCIGHGPLAEDSATSFAPSDTGRFAFVRASIASARRRARRLSSKSAGTCDAPFALMSTTRFAVALGFAAGAVLGCTRESSNPSSTVGQTEAQAWSRSTANDAIKPANDAPRTTVAVPTPTVASAGVVELPPGTSLAEDSAVSRGTDRIYQTDLTYQHAVDYFDHLRSNARCEKMSCEKTSRMTTETATFWSLRCPDGASAYMAVRNTLPTTIEVLAGSEAP
jgi:hypothetical protein